MELPTNFIQSRLVRSFLFSGLVLLVPLFAMLFTNEVNWGIMDFIIGGVILTGLIFTIDILWEYMKSNRYRIFVILGVVLLFLLIWVELAVGIFGSPFSGS